MDFVFAILMSTVTPFLLNYYNVPSTQGLGLSVSSNILSSFYKINTIMLDKNSDYITQKFSYSGMSKIDYEVTLDNIVYINDTNYWFAFSTSWSPLQHQLDVVLKSPKMPTSVPKKIYFNEGISSGFKLGYEIKMGDDNSLTTLSPYLGISFMKVAYEGAAYYDVNASYDSVMKYKLGLDFSLSYKWHVFTEISAYFLDVLGITENKQNLEIDVYKIKLGVYFKFNKDSGANTSYRNSTYDSLVQAIDPNLIQKQKQEEPAKPIVIPKVANKKSVEKVKKMQPQNDNNDKKPTKTTTHATNKKTAKKSQPGKSAVFDLDKNWQ